MSQNSENNSPPTTTKVLQMLKDGCSGKEFAAVRCRTELLPIEEKVFPPTYSGGQYATEGERKNAKGDVEGADFVLLDSVQSQANRMELALLAAINAGRVKLPIIRVKVDFTQEGRSYRYPNINSFTVPHRVSDAIIRDSTVPNPDDQAPAEYFWESVEGAAVTNATIHNARAFFKYCPTALLFGTWDSHSFTKRGLNSAKVARALCSEVTGVEARPGKRTASRVDPLHLSGFYLVKTGDGEYDWKIEEGKPEEEKKKRAAKKQLKLSEWGHGNVTPDFRNENRQINPGGFYIREAIQTAVLSFAQLRRLAFAEGLEDLIKESCFQEDQTTVLNRWKELCSDSEKTERAYNEIEQVNIAGRTVVAALGVAALALLHDSPDCFNLRSRCDLIPKVEPKFEFLPLRPSVPAGNGEAKYFIDSDTAIKVLEGAVNEAKALGLVWRTEPIELEAGSKLRELIVASEEAQARESPEEP